MINKSEYYPNIDKHEKIAKANPKKYVALPHPSAIDYWTIGRPGIIIRHLNIVSLELIDYTTRDAYIINSHELNFDNQDEAEDFATLLNMARNKRKK